MPCSDGFIAFVQSQLESRFSVTARRMFGDWCIYIDGKPLLLACDDMVYVRKHPSLSTLLAGCECASPYPGAKDHYILDMGHADLAAEALRILWPEVPFPKPRR